MNKRTLFVLAFNTIYFGAIKSFEFGSDPPVEQSQGACHESYQW